MKISFGPWSTAINTGAPQQLDTFWKRRLAMLPSLNQTESRATRRTLLCLGIVAVAALALPTMKWVSHKQSVGSAVAVADETAQPADAGKASPAVDRREKPGLETKDRDAAVVVEYLPRPSREEAAVEESLDIEVIDMPFEECVKLIAQRAKINVVLDYQTLADDGVVLDRRVTLKSKGGRAGSVLNLLLKLIKDDKIELGILFEDDQLKITTAAKAGERLITRWYPVWDLHPGAANSQVESSEMPQLASELNAPPHIAGLIKLMTVAVQPDSWEDLHGPGSVVYAKEIQCLIIRQTSPAQHEILQFLRLWREAKRMERAAVAGIAPNAVPAPVRHEREDYSLVGNIDLNGDGKEDTDLVRALLTAAGCSIHEIDAKGNLRINGSVSEDGKPRIFAQTKFVVIGKFPEITADTSPDETARIRKLFDVRQELQIQASKQGTRVVSLRDFLNYLGYKSKTDKSKDAEDAPLKLKEK